MSADYRNWMPKEVVIGLGAGTVMLTAAAAGLTFSKKKHLAIAAGAGAALTGAAAAWAGVVYETLSYDGKRKVAKRITDGIADCVAIPDGGIGLDIGCGTGALTIACAKRNPKAKMVGIDRWGIGLSNGSKSLCETNAAEEGVENAEFCYGDAADLDFPDGTFDAVTSNYVYHLIKWHNKQDLLRETLRVLKKGGTFAIHDVFARNHYGDIRKFMQEMRDAGFERVSIYDTTKGEFMSPGEAAVLLLKDSAILCGVK